MNTKQRAMVLGFLVLSLMGCGDDDGGGGAGTGAGAGAGAGAADGGGVAGSGTADTGTVAGCPDEMLSAGTAPGCCVPNSNKCGIVDIISGSGCVAREMVPIKTLAPLNCDGSPLPAAGSGAAGMM